MTSTLEPGTQDPTLRDDVAPDLDSAVLVEDVDNPSELPSVTPRTIGALALSCSGTAIVTGGVFIGVNAKVVAVVAAVLGVLLAAAASRLKGAISANVAIIVGVVGIGLLAMLFSGVSNVTHTSSLVRDAAHEGGLLRPPVPFDPGWHALVAWLLGLVGVVAGWVAFVLRKPTAGLLLPLPLAVVSGISVPADSQITIGIVAVVLFTAALGLISTGQLVGDDQEQKPSLGFQVRRALRSIVVLAVIATMLVFVAKANFLFPRPSINPATKAQLPRVTNPKTAPNRPLFTVDSPSLGPFRAGDLDVYDGAAWRFAPVADSTLAGVGSSGVVNGSVSPGITTKITIQGYSGSTLPSLSNLYGIAAQGPKFAYEPRSDTIRVSQGQVTKGLVYTTTSAALPTIAQLQADVTPVPSGIAVYEQAPPVPADVQALITRLKKPDPWDTFVALRGYLLSTVTAEGPGIPIAVPPSRVESMLFGAKTGTPFEVTAATALLSRWAGIPARIGFGFQVTPDGKAGTVHVIEPKDAATYPEVYFPGYGWLPVIGNPSKAQASSKNTQTRSSSDTKASSTFSVSLALPVKTAPPSNLPGEILRALGILIGLGALGAFAYFVAPAVRKSRRRSKLRRAARKRGPAIRMALAYAEWRDVATDFGFLYESDSPLAFLEHFGPDAELEELSWLITRGTWGDLQGQVTDEMAGEAETLSRTLRRRLASAQPPTLRVLAALSRLSLKHPAAPDLIELLLHKPEKSDDTKEADREPASIA